MATSVQQKPVGVRTTPSAATGRRVGTDDVWNEIAKASFATLSYVTPTGEPRSSGVVYVCEGRRLYVAVAPDSWKARHLATAGRAAVVVPVRRFALLSLFAPVPPATISFQAEAIVHAPGPVGGSPAPKKLLALLPEARQAEAAIIELIPEGQFLVYGLGCSLTEFRDAPSYHVPTEAGR